MSTTQTHNEPNHEHNITSVVGVSKRPSGDSLRGAQKRRQGTNEPSHAGTLGAVRDSDQVTDAPDFTTIGELSDDAIEALAALLVDNYLRKHQPTTAQPVALADSFQGRKENEQ